MSLHYAESGICVDEDDRLHCAPSVPPMCATVSGGTSRYRFLWGRGRLQATRSHPRRARPVISTAGFLFVFMTAPDWGRSTIIPARVQRVQSSSARLRYEAGRTLTYTKQVFTGSGIRLGRALRPARVIRRRSTRGQHTLPEGEQTRLSGPAGRPAQSAGTDLV